MACSCANADRWLQVRTNPGQQASLGGQTSQLSVFDSLMVTLPWALGKLPNRLSPKLCRFACGSWRSGYGHPPHVPLVSRELDNNPYQAARCLSSGGHRDSDFQPPRVQGSTLAWLACRASNGNLQNWVERSVGWRIRNSGSFPRIPDVRLEGVYHAPGLVCRIA